MPRRKTPWSRSYKLPKVISREEAARLLAVPNPRTITGLRNRVALQLLYRAGLRCAELCNLSVDDVRLDEGYILVQNGKYGRDRTIPMDPETQEWCRRWMERRPESPWFLCTLGGNRLDERFVRAMVERTSRRAGVYLNDEGERKPVHPHILRHTFATERLEDGFNLSEVAQLLGHSNIRTTSIYLHVRPTALAEKMRRLPPVQPTQEARPCAT